MPDPTAVERAATAIEDPTSHKYFCPETGCKHQPFENRKGLAVHLRRTHKYKAGKVPLTKKSKERALPEVPHHNVKFCPGCGCNIEELEMAIVLLRREQAKEL